MVFAIIMLGGLLWNEWAFLALISVIALLCLREFFRIINIIFPQTPSPSWLPPAMMLFTLMLLWLPPALSRCRGDIVPQIAQYQLLPPLLAIMPLILLIAVLSKRAELMAGLAAAGAVFYIIMPSLMLYSMRLQSLMLPLALVLLIWTNDTMAYLVGSFIGRTPFSSISPKKTWEGTAGGALLTMALAVWWGWYSGFFHLSDWAALGLCASVAGTAGDLFESKLKRIAGIKDSGAIMPGHGGALDRFDSLLVATPFAFAYAYLAMPALEMKVF